MATTFSIGQEAITSYLFYGLLPLALFLPVYRPECPLGFVLGMCTVFGTVLPTLMIPCFAKTIIGVRASLDASLQPLRRVFSSRR